MGNASGTQTIGTPANIITGLPAASWRNLDSPPYDMANINGGWDLSEGAFPYIDGKSHDNMGRKEMPMSFRFYFVNTVQEDAFPKLFTEWFEAVAIDGTPDRLLHPIIGEVDARVTTWDLELVATRTAGVLLTVNWVDTLLDPEKGQQIKGVPVNVQEYAAAVDVQMHNLEIEYPTGERTTSFSDMVGQIDGLMFSARLRVEGMVNQALGVVRRVTEVVDHSTDHRRWALSFNLKSLYNGLQDFGDAVKRAAVRPTKVMITQRSMSLAELAKETGNTLAELMGLNPLLLGSPTVAKGVPVAYFK